MPGAPGLELLAKELGEAALETVYFRGRATLIVDPRRIRWALGELRARGYGFLSSVHGVDHYPDEPRLGVIYELLDMSRVDRVTVKARVPLEEPVIDSVTQDGNDGPGWPTADHQEREVYDMFGLTSRPRTECCACL